MDIHTETLDKLEKFNNRLGFFVRDYQKMRKMLDQSNMLLAKRNAEIAHLRAKYGEISEDDEQEEIVFEFEDLANKAKNILNMDWGWQTEYEKQSLYDHATLERWKKEGFVPAEAMVACDILQPATKKKRIDWKFNPALSNMVYELYRKNLSYNDIAEHMSKKYPEYEWSHNTIAGQISRMKQAST